MSNFFNNFIFSNNFWAINPGNPFINNSTGAFFSQNFYNFMPCSYPINFDLFGFNQLPALNFNTFNSQASKPDYGSLFGNFNFNFGSGFQMNSIYNNNNSGFYGAHADRKAITVDDIDYSIMGKDAAKVKLLRPEMQVKVYQMFLHAKEKGWTMTITSGYRSTQKQTYLYNEWKAGRYDVPVVAKPGTSRHEFGCAVDISVTCNGVSSSEIEAEMGRYGKSIGLRWGGDWGSKRENWHFDIDPKKTSTGYIC